MVFYIDINKFVYDDLEANAQFCGITLILSANFKHILIIFREANQSSQVRAHIKMILTCRILLRVTNIILTKIRH